MGEAKTAVQCKQKHSNKGKGGGSERGAQSSSRKSGGVEGEREVGVGGKKTLSSEEARKREAADLEGGREMGVAVQ